MNKTKILVLLTFAVSLFLISCEKENKKETPSELKYSNGAFILNEGNFLSANASISFLSSGDLITQNIFKLSNERPLGDVLQSMTLVNDLSYLVVGNSNKIEIVKTSDFSQQGVIGNLQQPRYMAVNGTKGYLTQWTTSSVAIINLLTNKVEKQIAVGNGPEGILIYGNHAYVANCGGWGVDSTVSVIDLTTESVVKTIEVGGMPKKIVLDKNNKIWVLCAGNVFYNSTWTSIIRQTPSMLVQISPDSKSILKEILISNEQHPTLLDISPNKQTLYYGGTSNGICEVGIHAVAAGTTKVGGVFYGFSIHPKNGEIYALEAPSFTVAGNLKRFSAEGQFLKEYKVGIGPNSVVFVE